MTTYIALLRGINVGKAKRIAMADLRALLEELGYTDVATLLNSGNVVFRSSKKTSAKIAAEISSAIAAQLTIDVPVIVKSTKELAAIIADNPFADTATDPSRLLVAFTPDAGTLSALDAIAPKVVAPEQFLVGTHAAYLHCASGILESKAGEALVGKAGRAATTRNWTTVLKLQALVDKIDA
ncbi:uncharacterized protein (DUF1697 family) [Pseudoxanthomonas japonensis]|uniref:DUF1697 domain-containing protein n=1 Tax=Pseudoxanthomonas japonensis TaxID=69284 RepID=UPI002860DCBA|nr:DUF1697 domain-containing protein [Pseudoxanthomonas japonensis]MDR7068786.1 uncharacterized protein (DUF1697 family) [Pseudoxanthomonas japonensis]